MKDIQWLFFDVGSTLIDESLAYEQRLREIAQAAALAYEKVLEMALEHYRENRKGDLETAAQLGVTLTPWHHEWEKPYPDALSTLKKLHQNYRIGIIANQSPGTARRLRDWGLLDEIDLVIASAEEGVSKPDRRIFELALRKSGCIPERSVMIGDRIDNDIAPAKQMGMKTVWVQQGFGKYWTVQGEQEQADFCADHLFQICDLF